MNDPTKLAGIGLGNMLLNLFGNGILIGVNTALETLVSQAYGRQNLRECGLYLHRSMFIVCCLFIPIAIALGFSKEMLVLVGINEEAAIQAQTYLTYMLPSVLFNSLGDSIDLFLIGMGFNNVVLLLQTAIIPLHFVCCWAFISHFKLGLLGVAIASNITALLTLIGQVAYVN